MNVNQKALSYLVARLETLSKNVKKSAEKERETVEKYASQGLDEDDVQELYGVGEITLDERDRLMKILEEVDNTEFVKTKAHEILKTIIWELKVELRELEHLKETLK